MNVFQHFAWGVKGDGMKKAVLLAIVCLSLFAFWKVKKTKSSITDVLPEKSVFFVDPDLSNNFKDQVISSISTAYQKSKSPQEVMTQATAEFQELSGMKVQICQTDKICFYVDAATPLFVLNDDFVVCDNAIKVARDHFDDALTQGLVKVVVLKNNDLDPRSKPGMTQAATLVMVRFVQALPEVFKQDFWIEWLDNHDILLHLKNNAEFVLQVTIDQIPTEKDLQFCQAIDNLPKKSKSKKKLVVYDLRFKNQIIIR
jgi:hypothetical protein